MKKDIENRQDIEQLVRAFYSKVQADPVIGYIFNDIARVNWERHFPVMFDFWENALFYNGTYSGNPIQSHRWLNQKVPLETRHFDRWLELFTKTIDELFEGDIAELARQKATSIATVMRIKIIEGGIGKKEKENEKGKE